MACCRKGKSFSSKLLSKLPPSVRNILADLFTSKTLDELEADSENAHMKKTLGWVDLTLLGVGAIIGSGIFVLTGQAAGRNAGPAVVLSFLLAGCASGLAALCYAELASIIPVSGSAYTYSYATMGELVSWMVGWDMMLEYLVGTATVAVGWSGYVTSFIHDVGGGSIIHDEWTTAPFGWNDTGKFFYVTGKYINVPAIAITVALTMLLIVGVQESAWLNAITVIIKLAVILIFCFTSIKFINPDLWKPFIPPAEEQFGRFGVGGILQATTVVFFAYIGFDALSTAAQECKNAQRDLPIGILASLVICTLMYMAVCLCLTGVMPYKELLGDHPIAHASQQMGQPWLAIVTEIGAIAGLTSAMLVALMSQPRIFFSMASDGLFPSCIAKTHPRFGTPIIATIITGVITSVMSGLLPIDVLGELNSIGTLFAFMLVSIGVTILRVRQPELPRSFKVPLGPYVIPLTSAACSLALIAVSTKQTKIRLFAWMFIGLVIYFAYGMHHSRFRKRLHERRLNPLRFTQESTKLGFERNITVPAISNSGSEATSPVDDDEQAVTKSASVPDVARF